MRTWVWEPLGGCTGVIKNLGGRETHGKTKLVGSWMRCQSCAHFLVAQIWHTDQCYLKELPFKCLFLRYSLLCLVSVQATVVKVSPKTSLPAVFVSSHRPLYVWIIIISWQGLKFSSPNGKKMWGYFVVIMKNAVCSTLNPSDAYSMLLLNWSSV